jgi:enoyl-CoA hydratase/carnithine racemase
LKAGAKRQERVTSLRSEDHGRVRLLTLDRPEALNAFDNALYHATATALRQAAECHDVACVVITGAGRAFSAGQDIGEMSQIDPASGEATEHGFTSLFDALSTFEKPLVVAVNGAGVGIGMTMLLHADLVVMAEHARVRVPFTALGVAPEAASSYLLPAVVGSQAAAWALYTSAWVSAREALDWGLAWRVVPGDALLHEALEIAGEIAKMPTSSLVATKRLVLDARADLVRAANVREQQAFQRLLGGPANVEALTAFLEKREPDFAGLPPEA